MFIFVPLIRLAAFKQKIILRPSIGTIIHTHVSVDCIPCVSNVHVQLYEERSETALEEFRSSLRAIPIVPATNRLFTDTILYGITAE